MTHFFWPRFYKFLVIFFLSDFSFKKNFNNQKFDCYKIAWGVVEKFSIKQRMELNKLVFFLIENDILKC